MTTRSGVKQEDVFSPQVVKLLACQVVDRLFNVVVLSAVAPLLHHARDIVVSSSEAPSTVCIIWWETFAVKFRSCSAFIAAMKWLFCQLHKNVSKCFNSLICQERKVVNKKCHRDKFETFRTIRMQKRQATGFPRSCTSMFHPQYCESHWIVIRLLTMFAAGTISYLVIFVTWMGLGTLGCQCTWSPYKALWMGKEYGRSLEM